MLIKKIKNFSKKAQILRKTKKDYITNTNIKRKARIKLVKKLEKEGIKDQAQVKRRWLADWLTNEQAVALLLKFLKAIDVRGRKRASEQKKE